MTEASAMGADLAFTYLSREAFASSPQVGEERAITWPKLVEWLRTPEVATRKDAQGAFALAIFRDGRRKKDHVASVAALGVDVDHTSLAPKDAHARLRGARRIVYTTANHAPEAPRWRVIFGLSRPMSSAEHERVWRILESGLGRAGITPDPSCKDPSRLWYVPTVRPGREALHEVHVDLAAPPLDVDALLAREAGEPKPVAAPVLRRSSSARRGYVNGAIASAVERVSSAANGARNATLNTEAFGLAQLVGGGHLEEHVVRAELEGAARAAGLGETEIAKTLNSALAAGVKEPRNIPEPRNGSSAATTGAITSYDDWKAALLYGPEKASGAQIRKVTANAVTILAHDERWRDVLAFDAFREDVVAQRPPPWSSDDAPAETAAGVWTEADTVRCANWLAREWRLELGTIAVDQAIAVVAARNVVHPVRDYLASLTWDGTARIDRLFAGYFGAPDTEYTCAVSSRWMIGAVARVMRPGCKVDCTPMLEGAQGIGKSTAIRALAGDEWFFDTPITMGEKDSLQALRAKWICELAELHALNRSDLNKAKAFLTATFDTYRPSYGRRTQDHPRQIVFVGTTNATEYLRDETGNRRFWPVQCGAINFVALRRDRDNLWAEAVARFNRGDAWHVDSAEFGALCAAEQEDRFVEDAWEAPISAWLMSTGHPERRRDGVTSGEVLAGALKLETGKWTKADTARATAVLHHLEWERGRQERVGAARVRRWRPKAASLVTAGDDLVTPPVTGKSSTDLHMSPSSPSHAHVRTHAGAHARASGDLGSGGDGGDTGDAVTEHAFEGLL